MKKKDKLSRRDFLKATASTALLGAATSAVACTRKEEPSPDKQQTKAPEKGTAKGGKLAQKKETLRARVVLVRDDKVMDKAGNINAQILAQMLDRGVSELVEEPDVKTAWGQLLSASDTLGIKSNVWRFIPTPPELEEAIRQRALEQGIGADKIAVDDRGVLKNPIFQKASALINVRTLRTHHWSGIGSCIKNYIMFHPEPWTWHDDSCANLAGLWDMPNTKGKTRLNIQVVLTPLFHGKGPHHFQAEYTWQYKGLILGLDPVAVDATAVRLLEAKRKIHFGKTQPFAVPPKHVQVAQDKYGLGVADAKRIDLIRLGPTADALI